MKINSFNFNKPTVTPNVANKQGTTPAQAQVSNFSLNQTQTSQLLALFTDLQITSYEQLTAYLNNPEIKQYLNKFNAPTNQVAQNMTNPELGKGLPEVSKEMYQLMQQFAASTSRDHIIYSLVRRNMLKPKQQKVNEVTKATAFVFAENLTKNSNLVKEKPDAVQAINEYAASLLNRAEKKQDVYTSPITVTEKDKKLFLNVAGAVAILIPMILLLIYALR